MLLSVFLLGAGTSFRGIPLSSELMVVETRRPDSQYSGSTYGGSFGVADGGIRYWNVPAEFEHLFLNLHGKRLRIAIYQPVVLANEVDCEIWVYDQPDGTPTHISRRGMPVVGLLAGTIDCTAVLYQDYNRTEDALAGVRYEESRRRGEGTSMTRGRARSR